MASDRLKKLAAIRLVLSVIAVILAGLMVYSGVMHFGNKKPGKDPTDPTVVTTAPSVPETTAETAPETTAETEPETTADTEATEPSETVGNQDNNFSDADDDALQPESQEAPNGIWPGFGKPPHNPGKPGKNDTEGGTHDTETGKTDTEIGKTDTETGKTDTETGKTDTETGKTDTETGKTDTETGKTDTETGKTDTETGKTDTETGKTNTETGKTDTETGRTDTEVGKTDTEVGKTDTEVGKTDTEVGITDTSKTEESVVDDGLITTNLSSTPTTEAHAEASIPVDEISSGEEVIGEPEPPKEKPDIWGLLFWSSTALFVLDLAAILLISRQIEVENKRSNRPKRLVADDNVDNGRTVIDIPTAKIATVHQIGRRDYQQDSLGHAAVLNNRGILAVVADGMGGLSDGEKVSQQIVMDAISMGSQLRPGQTRGVLLKMLNTINENVNRKLGPEGLYKSGSTLVAVLACDGMFQWLSVGDSRIYLYRQGYASQLNRDHDQLQIWMEEVLAGRRNLEETLQNPDGRKLTSFIGMGKLRFVDTCHSPIPLEPGDRLVLMSDGIYNIIQEDRLAEILKRYPDVDQATAVIDRIIRETNHPHQDNYTAIVLGF